MTLGQERSINRYYDPTTDQFLSVDPLVDSTGQPYVFTNDNPLNATDPLGLKGAPGMTCIAMTVKACNAQGRAAVARLEKVGFNPVVLGILLGVVSVATGGAGLVLAGGIEAASATTIGVLEFTAVASGTGAQLLDANACLHGSLQACGGAFLGGIGSLSGGASLPIFGLSKATQYRLGAISLNAGIIGTTYDTVLAILHSIFSGKRK